MNEWQNVGGIMRGGKLNCGKLNSGKVNGWQSERWQSIADSLLAFAHLWNCKHSIDKYTSRP